MKISYTILCIYIMPFVAFAGDTLDFSSATIISGSNSKILKTRSILQSEFAARTSITLPCSRVVNATTPLIILGTVEDCPVTYSIPPQVSVPQNSEGFAIWVDQASSCPRIYLIGRKERGVLYAAGYLIRQMYLAHNFIQIKTDLKYSSAPVKSIRGDACGTDVSRVDIQSKDNFINWSIQAYWQQYLIDMVLFGGNIFTDGGTKMQQVCSEMGIGVAAYLQPADVVKLNSLTDDQIRDFKNQADIFNKTYWDFNFGGIDNLSMIITHLGDHARLVTPWSDFFTAAERVIPLVLESCPGVPYWLSPKASGPPSNVEYFYSYIQQNRPNWLYGVQYAPLVEGTIEEVRQKVPSQYKISVLPDICHPHRSMYPIETWDRAMGLVWDRNSTIYPVPQWMQTIFQSTSQYSEGFLSYSHTGAYNDVNRFVILSLGWSSGQQLDDILTQYARAFFTPYFQYDNPTVDAIEQAAQKVVRGIKLLEGSWTSKLEDNSCPQQALDLWQEIAGEMRTSSAGHWRLHLYLTKAFIDYQIKRKSDIDMDCESKAYAAIKRASEIGVVVAARQARQELANADIQMQSKTDFEAQMSQWGISETNGYGDMQRTLGFLYSSLNDRFWIEDKLALILRSMEQGGSEKVGLESLNKILNYSNPGSGGYYDDLGDDGKQPHLVRQYTYTEDPAWAHTPWNSVDCAYFELSHRNVVPRSRKSQQTHAVVHFDEPLVMRWSLDKNAGYYIEVLHDGYEAYWSSAYKIKCTTDDGFLIYGPVGGPTGVVPVRYEIPKQTYENDGILELRWQRTDNEGHNHELTSLTEIWVKKNSEPCTVVYAHEYDFNNDCIVNLADFAAMASAWYDCGLYPDCN